MGYYRRRRTKKELVLGLALSFKGGIMKTFDEWLADCPIPFTQTRDDGDTMTFTFEVSPF